MEEIESSVSWRIASDGRVHRKRFVQYPNGDKYEGELVHGQRDGFGTLLTSKFKYIGAFRSGLFEGKGKLEWNDFKENNVDVKGRKFEGDFRKGRRDGEGLFHDGKGGIFLGTWKNDKFQGKGKMMQTNRETLEGLFVNGKLHCDDGKITFSNGDAYEGFHNYGNSSYTGQCHYNMKHGIGIRLFVDGTVFRGNYLYNRINGQGKMCYAEDSGDIKYYSGEWKDGLFDEEGELIFNDCFHIRCYRGHFRKGLYHGYGLLEYRDGGCYEGEFDSTKLSTNLLISPWNGIKHGEGKRLWASGNQFEGTWANDEMLEGKYFDKFNSSIYSGTFTNDKKCGTSCREIWCSLDGKSFRDPCLQWKHKGNETCKYVGDYQRGVFHGKGCFSTTDGRKYDGEWKNGKQHGYGKAVLMATYQHGDSKRMFIGKHGSLYKPKMYEGEWKDGTWHGQGKLTFLDGSERSGVFVNGRLMAQTVSK